MENRKTLIEYLGEALFLATQDVFVHFGRAHIYRKRTEWKNLSTEDKAFFTNTAKKHFTSIPSDEVENGTTQATAMHEHTSLGDRNLGQQDT